MIEEFRLNTPVTNIKGLMKMFYKDEWQFVCSDSRETDLVIKRHAMAKAIRDTMKLSLKDIGRVLNRDHSSIKHSLKIMEAAPRKQGLKAAQLLEHHRLAKKFLTTYLQTGEIVLGSDPNKDWTGYVELKSQLDTVTEQKDRMASAHRKRRSELQSKITKLERIIQIYKTCVTQDEFKEAERMSNLKQNWLQE